jgi:hypothetical protein
MGITNLSLLKEFADGDEEFMLEILGIYQGETPQAIQKIKALTASQEWEELRKVVHKLKSSLSMIGLNDLLSIVTTMEQNIKEQINLEDLAGLSSQVIDQCQQSLPEVDQHIAEIS